MARIILLDDDDVFRETMVRVLTELGHHVRSAANGFDGMALFRAEPADLILTDLVMPHGGLQTIRVLRDENPKLAIIAMSGSHVRLDMAGGIGANRMLAKPFTAAQLNEAISEVLAPKS